MAGGAFAGLVGCNNGGSGNTGGTEGGGVEQPEKPEQPEHTEHKWSRVFSYENEDGHYYVTTCPEHPDAQLKGQVYAHKYDKDYKCMECGYEHVHVWTDGPTFKNGTEHYVATTCLSHRILKKERAPHVFDNDEDTTCSGCSYVRQPVHQHTFAAEFINAQEKGHYQMATCAGHTDQKSDYFDHEFAEGSNECDCGYTRDNDASVALASTAKVYLVGDSTVCSFNDSYYLPRYGYGTQLYQYLNVQANQIVNLAISGRSSKSYLTEANYATLKSSIKAGDYLIIGFGHNDEKSDDASRHTSPVGDHTTAGSFQESLYTNYVKVAKDAGATPILCTPITRYDASGAYTGSKVHVTSEGDYVQAVKNLGAATSTTVIDLTTLTANLYKSDNAAAQYFHAHTSCEGSGVNLAPTGRDDTHINRFGAEMVSYLFADALKDTDCSLKAQVITNKLAPTYGTHFPLAVKQGITPSDYAEFDPDNTSAIKLNGDWYRSYMGRLGTNSFGGSVFAYEGGKFTVGENVLKTKIGDEGDGFVSAFMQVDARKNFTISMDVTVKTVDADADKQSGYGLMLRDDIYLNKRIETLATNYVAAGQLNGKAPIFSRENGALTTADGTGAIAVGDTHKLSITRVGQVVTVAVDEATETYTDFDFLAVDGDYMYLCMFACRGITAEFTNVQFEITGNSLGA